MKHPGLLSSVRSRQRQPLNCGFTLVELLVVIAIIVVLLALLAAGLERALKTAERTKCGTNQRNVAQQCAQYALEYQRTFPVAWTMANVWPTSSVQLRIATAGQDDASQTAAAMGIGHLVARKRLPSAKLGDAINCPSLDTGSGVPIKYGMDEIYVAEESTDMVNQQTNNDNMAGGSYWSNATQNGYNIYGSYNYRALSYAKTHSNGTLRTNIAGSSGFGLTMDLVTANATATSRNYGRKFHHLDGWNIAYGDGHATYFQDPTGDEDPPTRGFVETVVVGGEAKGYKGPSGFPNDTAGVEINGSVKPGADEAVFKYFGAK